MDKPFNPALLVVDFQEDFCPPNGSLAVPSGRAIAGPINTLLSLPFTLKIATRDWHPANHVSFASNHAAPDNVPFVSTTTIRHPDGQHEPYDTLLWPAHCIQNTPGAELISELHAHRLDGVVDKGTRDDVEMYSAFRDPMGLCDTGLSGMLRAKGVSHVYVVGLAADYCVRATALHAAEDGFIAVVVEEATRPVDPERWERVGRGEVREAGVQLVSLEGEEVRRVRDRVEVG